MQSPDRPSTTTATRRPSPRLRAVVVAGGTAAALLAATGTATAAESTAKASGTTTVKLASSFTASMKRSKISLSGVSPARRGATAVKLPLKSATIDAEAGSGTLNHSGALRFRRGKRSITLKTFRVAVLPTGSNISVGVGSSRVRIATVDTSGVKIAQGKRKLTLSNLDVKLTAIGASRLNRALGVTRFRSGASLGAASAAIDTPAGGGASGAAAGSVLKSGVATLSLTNEAKGGIAASGGSISTVAPATGSGTGPFSFPITGGSLDASKAFAGQATLGGAMTLTAQGQTLTLQDPIVDLAGAVITANVNGARVEAFSLDVSPLRSVRYDGQLVLDGIVVKRARSGPLSDTSGQPAGVIGTLRLDAKTD
ncbi:HtaA domain-containing protein [Patulibacter sp.]|uniref:HtaA domain-containing protein n=1 Tax=Patulibacter sp. TaxID=1912859 RepID=UPI002715B88D|nr:HtaA domain-containing protein [Patulibacter sp.]MDO9408261.1 hypothetical protein [Patulibacter sp.]